MEGEKKLVLPSVGEEQITLLKGFENTIKQKSRKDNGIRNVITSNGSIYLYMALCQECKVVLNICDPLTK